MLPTYTVGQAALVFTLVGTVLLLLFLFVSWLVRQEGRESETYECGMLAEGNNRTIGFNYIGYALLFLVFDLAALYLFMYAMAGMLSVESAVGFAVGILTLLLLILFGTKKRRYYVA